MSWKLGIFEQFMHGPESFLRFVPASENYSALIAVQNLADDLREGRRAEGSVFVYGPSGTGKTHLLKCLVDAVASAESALTIRILQSNELVEQAPAEGRPDKIFAPSTPKSAPPDEWDEARQADLLVIEDLQFLPFAAASKLAALLDLRQSRGLPTVLSANTGPQGLVRDGRRFPAKLVNRLGAGLVVGLEPLQAASRLVFLQTKLKAKRISVGTDILHWLAQRLTGGGRQLDRAIAELDHLRRRQPGPLTLEEVRRHFDQPVPDKPLVERILDRVCRLYQADPRLVRSQRRYPSIVLPRQVGMYLARQLTELSLKQIGKYFGGRDHTTVMHTCRKVDEAVRYDPLLAATVRQLRAELA